MKRLTHNGMKPFRDVMVTCLECGSAEEWRSQTDAGRHEWYCDNCDDLTTHLVEDLQGDT